MSRPASPAGQASRLIAISPLSTRVNGPRRRGGNWPDRHRAGDVGGAVGVLPAAVDQQQLARRHRSVRRLRHAVMHDRAVRPGAADRVERDVAQLARRGADFLEPPHHVDLGQPALGRRRVEPAQELGHRRPVAQMRGPRAGDLGRGLAGLGQDAGIDGPDHLGPRRRKPVGDPDRRRSPCPRATRPPSASSSGPNACDRAATGPRPPSAAAASAPTLRGSMTRSTVASARRIAKASATGVRATSPPRTFSSQAIESGSVRTTAAERFLQPVRERCRRACRQSCARRAPRDGSRSARPAAAAGPSQTRSTRFCDARQRDLPRLQRLGQRCDLGGGVQPGIEADAPAAGQRLGQPVGGLVLGQVRAR